MAGVGVEVLPAVVNLAIKQSESVEALPTLVCSNGRAFWAVVAWVARNELVSHATVGLRSPPAPSGDGASSSRGGLFCGYRVTMACCS